MKSLALFAMIPTVLVATTAEAHFKLTSPADRLVTDDIGDPMGAGGSQKTTPCGGGTLSGMVTQVRAGAMLHVKLTETVAHGGHYRIALVPKLGPTATDIPDPQTTVTANNCESAAIQSSPVAPVLADGLFVHDNATAQSGKVWETDVPMPMQTGSATLQIIEFMTPHAPGCFYYHCAELDIVAADAGIEDGGLIVNPTDGGGTGTPGTPSPNGDGSTNAGGSSSNDGSASAATPRGVGIVDDFEETGPGCSVGKSAGTSASFAAFALAVASLVRRRRKRK